MPNVAASAHGESRVRLLRLTRRGDRHDPRDLTVSLRFEGDFAAAFTEGRAAGVVPGEALKTFVHTTARAHAGDDLEPFGLALCHGLLQAHPPITRVRAEISEQPWHRLDAGGKPQGQAFVLGGPEQRTAAITSNGTQIAVVSGIENLTVMRTAGLAQGRTPAALADARADGLAPLLVGAVTVRWTYLSPDVTFGVFRQGIRAVVTETLALHARRSVEHTLYGIADVLLDSYPEIADVSLAMHERPYRPVDLFHAHVENPDELFVAGEEPVGVVEVVVSR